MQRLPSFAGGKKIAGGKIYICRLSGKKFASETLADGKRFICRRQTKNLQSASAPLAIGKIHI